MLTKKNTDCSSKHESLLHSQWLEHIANCTQEQQNPKAYCVQQGLSLKRFKHHERLERCKQKQRDGHFVEVNVVSEPVAPVSHYEIVYPRGVSLRVLTSDSLPALLKLLEVYL